MPVAAAPQRATEPHLLPTPFPTTSPTDSTCHRPPTCSVHTQIIGAGQQQVGRGRGVPVHQVRVIQQVCLAQQLPCASCTSQAAWRGQPGRQRRGAGAAVKLLQRPHGIKGAPRRRRLAAGARRRGVAAGGAVRQAGVCWRRAGARGGVCLPRLQPLEGLWQLELAALPLLLVCTCGSDAGRHGGQTSPSDLAGDDAAATCPAGRGTTQAGTPAACCLPHLLPAPPPPGGCPSHRQRAARAPPRSPRARCLQAGRQTGRQAEWHAAAVLWLGRTRVVKRCTFPSSGSILPAAGRLGG